MAKETFSNYVRSYVDWKVIVCVCLTGIGLLSVFSATHDSAMAGHFTANWRLPHRRHSDVPHSCFSSRADFRLDCLSRVRIRHRVPHRRADFRTAEPMARKRGSTSSGSAPSRRSLRNWRRFLRCVKVLTLFPADLRRISNCRFSAGIVAVRVRACPAPARRRRERAVLIRHFVRHALVGPGQICSLARYCRRAHNLYRGVHRHNPRNRRDAVRRGRHFRVSPAILHDRHRRGGVHRCRLLNEHRVSAPEIASAAPYRRVPAPRERPAGRGLQRIAGANGGRLGRITRQGIFAGHANPIALHPQAMDGFHLLRAHRGIWIHRRCDRL